MSFGWDYPPGVTGNEYEIAGPDHEWEAERWCSNCQASTTHTCQSYGGEAWASCEVCDQTEEIEMVGPDDDPDRVRDD